MSGPAMCKLTWIVFRFALTFALRKCLPGVRRSHLPAVPAGVWEAAGGPCPRPHLRQPQVSLAAPETNGLWLAAVTNSPIIDFMILRLKLLYNNTQKCLMGSIQSHKNYLLNTRFKTINLLFSINNGSPKNRRQLNVSTAFLREKWLFNIKKRLLPRRHRLAGRRSAAPPRPL